MHESDEEGRRVWSCTVESNEPCDVNDEAWFFTVSDGDGPLRLFIIIMHHIQEQNSGFYEDVVLGLFHWKISIYQNSTAFKPYKIVFPKCLYKKSRHNEFRDFLGSLTTVTIMSRIYRSS